MLADFEKPRKPEKEEMKEYLKEEKEKLAACQMKIKEAKLPVMVIFEGWGSAGKGSALGEIIKNIDPRFFQVATMDKPPTEEERRKPFLYRYFIEIPEKGKFKFFDTCWMEEVTDGVLDGKLTEKEYDQRVKSINITERQLVDNGYLVMKFFFHISEKEQKDRLDALLSDPNTAWRVSEEDLWENEHYKKCLKVYDRYLKDTDRGSAPWYIIDADNKKWALLQVLRFLNQGIETALSNSSVAAPIRQNVFRLNPMPKLKEIPLDREISEEEYKVRLKELQEELHALHYALYNKKIPVIIAYEGWDAAGKGGNIKRIAGALDPRGYVVYPIASPPAQDRPHRHLRQDLVRPGHGGASGGVLLGERLAEGLQRDQRVRKGTVRLGGRDRQVLDPYRFGYPAGTLYGPAEHPGEAVEDHGRRLAQPGEMGPVRSSRGRDAGEDLHRVRPLVRAGVGRQKICPDQGA